MPGRLKLYVAVVTAAALSALVALATTLDFGEVRSALPTLALFTALLLLIVMFPVVIRHNDRTRKYIVANTTFAVALIPLVGVPMAALANLAASLLTDVARRRGAVKATFNAASQVLFIGAGGWVYVALGGSVTGDTISLGPLLAGGAVAALVNHLLVSTVVSLAEGIPLRVGLRRDLRLELSSSAVLLALVPVVVAAAERNLLLVVPLVLPLIAVHRALQGEVDANQRRREAEEATEREQALRRKEQEVTRRFQEADRMKADLIAMVSHELRNPLTTVLGTFGLLRAREGHIGAGERAELIGMGVRQTERLRRMIEQLLLAARFEQHGTSAQAGERVDLDAAELVRQAGNEARARHRDRPILVDAGDHLRVHATQDAIVQVLGNLVDNACKYSPGRLPVRLEAARANGHAVLSVSDAGPGVPPAERERIFEQFTQLDGSHEHRDGGVGLGLYIARQLARSLDGDLVVTDARDGGARFELHLPLARPPAPLVGQSSTFGKALS